LSSEEEYNSHNTYRLANSVGEFCAVPVVHTITLGEIVDLLYSFKNSRGARSIPNMSDGFTSKLYSTYLSYLPQINSAIH